MSSIVGSRYQWKKNGADIPGATSREYARPTVALSDSGSYSVTIVTDCGTVESAVAMVTVTKSTSVREVMLPSGKVSLVGEMPVTDICKVMLEPTELSDIIVQVVDMRGGTTSVSPVRLTHAGGAFVLALPCNGLAAGSYLLDVRMTGHQALIPFIVSR